MTTIVTGRRDPRYPVRPQTGTVEFEHLGVGVVRGSLCQISISGISFVTQTPGFQPTPESRLNGVRIAIGDCRIRGDVVVRHANAMAGSRLEIGGLFHPATDRDVQTLMVLITGIDCANAAD